MKGKIRGSNIADRLANCKPRVTMPNDTLTPENQPLERRRAQVKGAKRWIKRARIGFALITVLMGIYIFSSYGVYTLPGEYVATSNKIQSPIRDVMPGDTVVLLNLNLWREPKLDDIVIYDHPDPKDGVPGRLIGRIAGLPGERVVRNGPTMQVGDRPPLPVGFPFGPDVAVRGDAVIPEGEYLIVADNDAVAYADSRDFGYVKRDAILKKVIFNLATMIGQRQAE
jgi:signal peptidase I